jgi:hypothetical protein
LKAAEKYNQKRQQHSDNDPLGNKIRAGAGRSGSDQIGAYLRLDWSACNLPLEPKGLEYFSGLR